ncbi:hypothetical protein LCGC14_2114090, partial [marine sediment metagenome]
VNWPFWKPYAQVRGSSGGQVRYGVKRTYGNGRMVYQPDLTTDAFTDGVATGGVKGIKAKRRGAAGPNLHPEKVGQKSSITFVIDSPYTAVDAWLDVAALRKTDKDVLAIHAKGRSGGWKKVWSAEKTGKLALEKIPLKQAAWFGHRYLVKFEMAAGANVADVGIDSFRITTVFMNNIYSLPYFMPGKNKVRLAAATGADLKANKLTLEYAWSEQGKDKTLTRQVEKLPLDFTVDVGGKDLPRMKHLKLSVAP